MDFKAAKTKEHGFVRDLLKGSAAFFILLAPLRGQGECSNASHRNPYLDLRFLYKASIVCDVEKDPNCEKDNRETYDEYAQSHETSVEALQDKFSGTRSFYCGNTPMGTANLVRRNNLIGLTAHQFYNDDGSCTPIMPHGDFSSCYFETSGPRGEKGARYYIESSTLKVGTKCPSEYNAGDDWAVVRLKKAVEGVTPYRAVNAKDLKVPNDSGYDSLIGLKTTTVVAQNYEFKKNGHKYPLRTPTICDDSIRGIQAQGDKSAPPANFIAHACSSSGGNSGGAILLQTQGSASSLVGILAKTKDSSMDHVEYGKKNFTSGPLLEGRFYETLMGM